ncbi:hypothetical protein MB901379_02483 [Mycobacterium basiliense]|uniref:DUF732 domain-containing protein n=1 Tax=Mycobacterium basiliense TaxID=2094119 RepID=A0A3S4FN20_9MYCO|nr:DUF732 domain-containing protein [Mycobacterium basiliense]VDM88916.1 hypothetical protein MB901379_02483 [Mycobacterium basiliense]
MKAVLALLGACAMIGLAAPAYAHPDENGDDAGFLSALQQAGITYSDPGQAIGSAKAVCWCLDGGESGLELVHDVKTHNPGFNMEAASQFAMLAAKFYCPHHLNQA